MARLRVRRTSQPQFPVGIDRSNPLSSGLVAVISAIDGTNLVNNYPAAGASGIGVALSPNGRIADFIGKASTSKVTSTFLLTSPTSTTPGDRTYFIPFLRNGSGGGNFGRLFQKGSNECYLMEDVATNTFVFVQSNSGGGNLSTQRFSPPGGLSGTVGWHTLAITITAAGTVLMYLDGVSQGLTGSTYTNGATTQTGAFVLGNRSTDNARVWNGQLGNLSIFDRILTVDQIQQLINNQWQVFSPLARTLYFGPVSGGSTGTVAYTNANDTSAASGTTTVTGSLARTNANDTSAASGTTTIIGSLAYSNANDTINASGTTTVTGTLAKTNANDTLSASGSVGNSITGTVAYTNANDTLAASGTTTITGTVSRTNANDTSAANGTTTVLGTVAYTNINDTVAASGIAGTISGTVAYTNANDISTASGTAGQPSVSHAGGYGFNSRPPKTRQQIEQERIDLGIIPAPVARIAQKIARKAIKKAIERHEPDIADWTARKEQQVIYERQLRAELAHHDQVWNQAYQRLFELAVHEALLQRDEEETLLMMLMSN